MTFPSLLFNGVCHRVLLRLACLSLLGSLANCAPEEYAQLQMDDFPMVSASLELAEQRITEKTRYAQFLSDTEARQALNVAIQKKDKDGINRVLAKFGAYASRYRYRPTDLSTLLAANDTLPGPVSPARTRVSASHLGWIYGVQLIGKGSRSGGSTTGMTYLEPLAYATYSYDLPNQKGYLFGGLGPYVALGLWGKIKSGNYSSNTFDSKTGYGRFDAGLAFTAGYQHPQGLRFSVVREMGLLNINTNNPDESTYNRVWSLNVAYPLKKLVMLAKKK